MINNIDTILSLIRADNFITVNKSLAKNIGLLPATMYVELCSKYNYYAKHGCLKDGYFYCTIETLKEEIGLSREEQDTAFKKLIKTGLIDKKVAKLKGDDAPKRYIKIIDDINLILSFFQEKETKNHGSIGESGFVGFTQIELRDLHKSNCGIYTTNNINNNNIIFNKNNQLVSCNESEQTNELTSLFTQSQVEIYPDEIKEIIKESIKELYLNNVSRDAVKRIDIYSIDEAISRYREAQGQKDIKNPKLYFKKCLLSAIEEGGLKNLNDVI